MMDPQEKPRQSTCPVCHASDTVQAVPDVYQAGYIQLPKPPAFGLAKKRRLDVRQIPGVSSLNILSADLAPPPEPVFAGAFFTSRGQAGPGWPLDTPAFIFVAIRYLLTAGAVGGIVWFVLRSPAAGGVVIAALLAWQFIARFRSERRKADQARRDHILWEHENAGWQQLFYCDRDSLVFLPGRSETAPPQSWRQALLPNLEHL